MNEGVLSSRRMEKEEERVKKEGAVVLVPRGERAMVELGQKRGEKERER